MRRLFLLLMLGSSFQLQAQKRNYIQVGPAVYVSTKGSQGYIGGGLGAGASKGIGGLGIQMELIARERQVLLPVYADMRCYFGKKLNSVYVSLQPGYNFRNNPSTNEINVTYKDKGGMYAGAGIGYYVFNKKVPGLNVQLKYVFMQDKLKTIYQYYTTVKNTHAGFISLCAMVVID
ncbi:MAG: hypothetical protein JST81_15695 [Bacteroidetes bacterium]|nr:hypothetical protein [Bacteroidota bacterium]